jgi:RNA polymerase sigma-70 factor, ECF subfamily
MNSLREEFLSLLPAATRLEVVSAEPKLDQALGDLWRTAHQAWPELKVSELELTRALAQRRSVRAFALADIHAGDFLLSVAALAGDRNAHRAFESEVLGPLGHELTRSGTASTVVDDVLARVRTRMLVGGAEIYSEEESKPRLAQYTGQVPLLAWLRVVVRRELISFLRSENQSFVDERARAESVDASTGALSPEHALLKGDSDQIASVALKAVIGRLDPASQLLLRWHFREGQSIDAIAPRLAVHRATAARMLARLRERLFLEVRSELQVAHKLGTSTVESLCAGLEGDLNLTLSRVL